MGIKVLLKQCFQEEYQLKISFLQLLKKQKLGKYSCNCTGGIWNKNDIDKFLAMGCVTNGDKIYWYIWMWCTCKS